MKDKKENDRVFYLLVKDSCDGIEDVLFLSDDLDEIKKVRAERIDVTYDEIGGVHHKFYTKEKFSDFFCIMKWNGKEFECVCLDVGLSMSEPKLW